MALVTGGHAFISYAREDKLRVDELQQRLEEVGIPVWRDTARLWPGEEWRAMVRDAITRDALVFIACFSKKSVAKDKGYQYKEITLAIEQFQRLRPGVPWLIPVRFNDCEIPEYDLGGGRTLSSLQITDIFGVGRNEAMTRLVQSVLRILRRDSRDPLAIKPARSEPPRRPARESGPRPDPAGSRSPRRAPDSRGNARRHPGGIEDRQAIDSAEKGPIASGMASHASHSELGLGREILLYAMNDGPDLLKSRMPEFADDHYRKLMRASATAGSIAATRELVEISQKHHHIQGEVCWLAVACRLHPPGTGGGVALKLADIYRRFELEESARPLIASAAIDGEDDAVADFLSWPDSVREQVAKKSSARSTPGLLRRAAEAGSAAAARELGYQAFTAGQYEEAITYLQKRSLADDPRVMYMLGTSLLRRGRRESGLRLLRKAAQRGDSDARLRLAASAAGNQPIKELVSQLTSKFDAGELRSGDQDARVRLLLELANNCGARHLSEAEAECLKRAVRLGSDIARIRLGRQCLERGRLAEASQWFEESSLAHKIPDQEAMGLIFWLACDLHWAGDSAASKRWLEAAAAAGDAAAIEILAEVSPIPRPRPRRLLHSKPHRMSAVLTRLDLIRTVLGAVATVVGLVGIGILGTATWLFFSNLIDSTGFSAVGYEILALALIAPGAGVTAASFWLYERAAERR